MNSTTSTFPGFEAPTTPIRTETVWITSDGTRWQSSEAAHLHARTEVLAQWFAANAADPEPTALARKFIRAFAFLERTK